MKYKCECGNTCVVSQDKYHLTEELYCSQCKRTTYWTPIEWPELPVDREIWFNGDNYLKCSTMGKCFECKKHLTNWVSLSFEGHLCSPVCAEKAWSGFFGVN